VPLAASWTSNAGTSMPMHCSRGTWNALLSEQKSLGKMGKMEPQWSHTATTRHHTNPCSEACHLTHLEVESGVQCHFLARWSGIFRLLARSFTVGISRLCLMDPIDPFGILIVGTHHAVRAARGLDFRQTRTDAGTIQRGQGKFSDSLHVVHSGISWLSTSWLDRLPMSKVDQLCGTSSPLKQIRSRT
jgi:hypothetical protein